MVLAVMASLIMFPVLYVAVFHWRQAAAQKEMEKKLDHELLVSLDIPLDELYWIKPGKELLIDGEMFDVKTVTYHKKTGKATLTGLYDKKEKKLFDGLTDMTDESGNDGNTTTLSKIFKFESIANDQADARELNYSNSSTSAYSGYDEPLNIVFLSVPTPPPLYNTLPGIKL